MSVQSQWDTGSRWDLLQKNKWTFLWSIRNLVECTCERHCPFIFFLWFFSYNIHLLIMMCLKKPYGKVNGKLPALLFYVKYWVIVSPFVQSVAHASIPQNALFMRSEWSRLQDEDLKLPLPVLETPSPLTASWLAR